MPAAPASFCSIARPWRPAPPDRGDRVRRAAHLLIAGRVQGVGYRAWVADAAARHGLDGWVRNLADGRVEAVLAGEEPVLGAMIGALREGPPLARVAAVVEDATDDPGPGFRVLPTARGR